MDRPSSKDAQLKIAAVGLVAFTKTLAKEGTKYNIKTNVIAPVRRSELDHKRVS